MTSEPRYIKGTDSPEVIVPRFPLDSTSDFAEAYFAGRRNTFIDNYDPITKRMHMLLMCAKLNAPDIVISNELKAFRRNLEDMYLEIREDDKAMECVEQYLGTLGRSPVFVDVLTADDDALKDLAVRHTDHMKELARRGEELSLLIPQDYQKAARAAIAAGDLPEDFEGVLDKTEGLHVRYIDPFEFAQNISKSRHIAQHDFDGRHFTVAISPFITDKTYLKKVMFHELTHAISGKSFSYKVVDTEPTLDTINYEGYLEPANEDEFILLEDDALHSDEDQSNKTREKLLELIANRALFAEKIHLLTPVVRTEKRGLGKGKRYRWLDEAVTEITTQILLAHDPHSDEPESKKRARLPKSGWSLLTFGSYSAERTLILELLTGDQIKQAISALIETPRAGKSLEYKKLHESLDSVYGPQLLPLLERYIEMYGIKKTVTVVCPKFGTHADLSPESRLLRSIFGYADDSNLSSFLKNSIHGQTDDNKIIGEENE